jgi:hypothetical protein
MRVFVACLLIIGLAVLMIIGLFRLVRELLSKSQFAAPSPPNEEHAVEIASSRDGRRQNSAGAFMPAGKPYR